MLNNFRAVPRRRDFLVALAGRSVSVFGDEVALVALTLRLQADGGHPYQVAVLLGAGLLPFVLLARAAGRVADSADSRRVLVCACLAQACCCVPLIVTGNVAVMAVFATLLGCGAAFAQATWQALVPRIVGEDAIGAATAAQQTSVNLAAVAAPAAAGLLAGAFGTRVPVAVDAVTFGVMTLAVLAVRTRRAGGRMAHRDSERGGWALLRADPVLGPLVLGLAAFVLLGFTVNVITVFLVRETLHASATWYGAVGATWVLGIVAGALAAGRITSRRTTAGDAPPATAAGGDVPDGAKTSLAAGQACTRQTPTGQTPTGQTPTGQTPTGQTTTGQAPIRQVAARQIGAGTGHVRAALAGIGLMSLAFAGYGLAPAVAVLVPVSILGGIGNGLANVGVATLVMTRSAEQVRGRVSAALGAVVNAASVSALVVAGGLAAVLGPRLIFLGASALGALATAITAARVPGGIARIRISRPSAHARVPGTAGRTEIPLAATLPAARPSPAPATTAHTEPNPRPRSRNQAPPP